ncbi:LPS export ABC transporter permease LptF [Thiohalorhabdus methylotrophus]|uniref:Lipopolysaccharide export system permease protein LptF n=1 Tax=Thiohalorhabdus methylotrophus TaxID=3242694 RepID=A0ABV4TU18_9GAMM
MKVLHRYVGLEVIGRAFLILALVTLLMLLAKGLEFLKDMAQGELPGEAVVALLGLAVPKILSLALPLALFFGLLTTISRLCMDSEMDALGAAGVGLYNLLPMVAVIAAAGAVLETGLTLWAEPAGQAKLERATADFQRQALTSLVRPQEFNEFPGGRVLYFDHRGRNGHMRPVFFYDSGSEPAATVTAEKGELRQNKEGQVEAVFHDGVRFQASFAGEQYGRLMHFERYRVRKSLGEVESGELGREALPTPRLIAASWGRKEAGKFRTELYRRLALPLSLPILMLLALPLGMENRRQGRSFGVLWGALLVLAYHNGLIVVEEWAGRGAVPPHWLLWAMPVPALLLAAYFLRQRVHSKPILPHPRAGRRGGRRAGAPQS